MRSGLFIVALLALPAVWCTAEAQHFQLLVVPSISAPTPTGQIGVGILGAARFPLSSSFAFLLGAQACEGWSKQTYTTSQVIQGNTYRATQEYGFSGWFGIGTPSTSVAAILGLSWQDEAYSIVPPFISYRMISYTNFGGGILHTLGSGLTFQLDYTTRRGAEIGIGTTL